MADRFRTQAYFDRQSLKSGEKDVTYYDDKVPGLGLRFRAEGKPKWTLYYGSPQRRYVVGPRSVSLDAARQAAQMLQANIARGVDIAEAKKNERRGAALARTFLTIVDEHLEHLRGRVDRGDMKPRTYAEIDRHLKKHCKPFHRLAIGDIERRTVAGRLRDIAKAHGPVAADRVRSSLSSFFAWCVGEDFVDSNPVEGTNKSSEYRERQRSLIVLVEGKKPNWDDIVAVWKGAPDNDYGKILRLLILTMCRRDEIASLSRSEIDKEARLIRIPGARTKNGREHVVPLSDAAMAIIEAIPGREGREFVFGAGKGGYSGWSKSKSDFDKAVKIKEPWTLHDLRRTGRTGLGLLGVAPHVAEAILNHLPPKLQRTYDTYDYGKEKRQALDLWADHLLKKVAGEESNIVPLRA